MALSPTLAWPGTAPRCTYSSKSSRNPRCSAKVAGWISPALATAWSSSKVTEIALRLCEDERIEIVPFSRGTGWFRSPHFPLQEGTFRGCKADPGLRKALFFGGSGVKANRVLDIGPLDCFVEPEGIRGVEGQRLLAYHVLPPAYCRQGRLDVRGVGSHVVEHPDAIILGHVAPVRRVGPVAVAGRRLAHTGFGASR